MASSSLPRWEYDVFLSFRGDDTRRTFVSHLYTALEQRGIKTFKDDQRLQQGKSISLDLVKHINLSSIAVIVFSKNYASSSWCLDEVVEIFECRRTKGKIVLPIFYYVEPSNVRRQKGCFGEAFYRHEELQNKERVERWRVVLAEAASLSGLQLENGASMDESKFIQQIVELISRDLELLSSPSHITPVFPTRSTPQGSSMLHSGQIPINLNTVHIPQNLGPPMSPDLPAIADHMQPISPFAEKPLVVTLPNGLETADLIKEIAWLKENLKKAGERIVRLEQTISELNARDATTMTSTDEESNDEASSGGHIPSGKRALYSNSRIEAQSAKRCPIPTSHKRNLTLMKTTKHQNSLTLSTTTHQQAKQPPIRKMKFEFHKPTSEDQNGHPIVDPPKEVSEEGIEYWKAYVVGYFLDNKMPCSSVVQPAAMRIWKDKGLTEVLADGKGFFYFKFDNLTATEAILCSGPWNIAGKQIMLMKWNPDLSNYEKEHCSLVPVWVKFYNIPKQFWTGKGLSYIASAVGKPLHADQVTESRKNLIFARICVEVDVSSSPLVDKFMLKNRDNTQVEIRVEYECVPKYCSLCSKIGHSTSSCQALSLKKTGSQMK